MNVVHTYESGISAMEDIPSMMAQFMESMVQSPMEDSNETQQSISHPGISGDYNTCPGQTTEFSRTTMTECLRFGNDNSRGRSNRRKQLNPVRITASFDRETETDVAPEKSENKKDDDGTEVPPNDSSIFEDSHSAHSMFDETGSTHSASANEEKVKMEAEQEKIQNAVTTVAVRLFDNQIMDQASLGLSGNNMSHVMSAYMSMAFRRDSPGFPAGNSASGMRIFNKEAYCEICNREFCNKYFLKTHKANKHGVYETAIPTTPFITTPPSTIVTTVSQPQLPIVPPSLPPQPSPSQNLTPLPSSVVNKPSTPEETGLSQSQTNVSAINLSTTVISNSLSNLTNNTAVSGAPNPETYCKLCNKNFCNKYFLKTHKQNIHGILEEMTDKDVAQPLPPTPPQNPSTPQNSENYCEICDKVFCNKYFTRIHKYNTHGILTPGRPVNSLGFGGLPGIPTTNGFMPQNNQDTVSGFLSDVPKDSLLPPPESVSTPAVCDICHIEFVSAHYLRIHKVSKHGVAEDSDSIHSGEKCNSVNLEESFKDEATASSDSIDTNEDVFICNVCNAKFSNRYVLEGHKLNQHGIMGGHDESADKIPDKETAQTVTEKSVTPEPNEDTPPPLPTTSTPVITASPPQVPVKSEQEEAVPDLAQELDNLRNALMRIERPRYVCDICSMEMPDQRYLMLHKTTFHGILPPNQKEIMQHQPDKNIIVDPEAYCDICQKQVCSKYFLRIHKNKMHGIPLEQSTNNVCSSIVSQQLTPPQPPVQQSQSQCASPETAQLTSVNGNKDALPGANSDRTVNIAGRNFCAICKKELCNKYFMKTHMLKMHGIVIDIPGTPNGSINSEYSQGSGATCDICNRVLCSKYFLKVHKLKAHGIDESGDGLSGLSAMSTMSTLSTSSNEAEDGHKTPEVGLLDPGNRYYSHYTEVCPICDRRFRSVKWLKSHVINDHAEALLNSPEAAVDPNENGLFSCRECEQNFTDKLNLQVHVVIDHRTVKEADNPIKREPVDCSNHSSDTESKLPSKPIEEPSFENVGMRFNQQYPLPKKPASTKTFTCSYCNYSTCWLSNLYAHEKRHVAKSSENGQQFVCHICHRGYRYNHSLQRHLLSHSIHSNSLPSSNMNSLETNGDQNGQMMPIRSPRYKCAKCNKKFRSKALCRSHIITFHRRQLLVGQAWRKIWYIRQGDFYKCRWCHFRSKVDGVLQFHLEKHHGVQPKWSNLPPNDFPQQDENRPIDDAPVATNKTRVLPLPIYQGVPCTSVQGPHILQEFLVQESSGNGSFVPTVVVLPVQQRVLRPITASFTLTPTSTAP